MGIVGGWIGAKAVGLKFLRTTHLVRSVCWLLKRKKYRCLSYPFVVYTKVRNTDEYVNMIRSVFLYDG